MQNNTRLTVTSSSAYLKWILIHLGIGAAIFVLPLLAKVYAIAIVVVGINYVVRTKNVNNEALYAAAYVIGAEVFLRMTEGNFFEQYAKYVVMTLLILGMIYRGFSKNSWIYLVFGLLLLPGVILAFFTLNFETDIRKAVTFNIVGPVTLMVCSIYCYQRKVTFKQLLNIIDMLAYPLMVTLVYMFAYTPSIKDVVTNTESNFETSGGFGPNQVSTILGLGIFLFFVKIILNSKNKKMLIINSVFFIVITFRGIVTFSRGGIIAGFLMIIFAVVLLLFHTKSQAKSKIYLVVFMGFFAFAGVWIYSSSQTSGLIDKRYANEDARGREKASKLTGREVLIESELNMFLENPIFGIGVGKNKEYRLEETGIVAASHNEITRMLAEHGMFGLFGLIILMVTPVLLYINNKQNIFLFSFLIFWLLTINHAAMRLAAPAFIYALSLLKVSINDE
jgi:O-antigen ligase